MVQALMANIIYNIILYLMVFWYWCFRWTLLKSFHWMNKPMNLFTSFITIIYLIPIVSNNSIISNSIITYNIWYGLTVFLIVRNIYYSVQAIIDFILTPTPILGVFLVVDVLMCIYLYMYLHKLQSKDW